ncbi:cytochrome c-type biogenesis protein CcmH [Kaistia hirudinis]|uniref:Cytochrome c-type biogenesis protein CcmH n=1 Tax=Kaistia hirudinis TaxID=1293440 RepID=A0A840ANA6_9HYPH|nr:c-type cytochrome biogenesis protein CcmI [Kaistia hirudinis]MBB3930753.1 cytochrome c-type biogenesis protein CcmH [Kaistia hirudinis]
MLLWIAMAVLTAVASLVVLAPLGRRGTSDAAADSAGSIYRDQLAELARDREAGLIAESEAEAARIEIARRLLKVTDAGADRLRDGATLRRFAVLVAIIGLPLIAVGTYLAIGSPNLADQPLAERRQASNDSELDGLVAKVEAHLAAEPNDGKGWEVIGPVYMRMGRFDDAARAFDNSRRLLGATPDRDALYGEALVRIHGGLVTADAEQAFASALKADPSNVRARFYIAIGLGQSGRKDEAVAAWKSLIDSAPADAPWLDSAKAELAGLEGGAPMAAAPGPTANDVAAAADQTPEQRQQMIEGMVSGLAARLDASPDDPQGWARLFRAYIVLGRQADAEAALVRARGLLAGKSDVLAAVEKAAADNGISAKAAP